MNKPTLIIVLLVSVTLATMFIRIPLPGGGYFNFGDVAVIFGGLIVGSTFANKRHALFAGFAIGGVGSAIADIMSGYMIFAPLTFLVKGFEGLLASAAGSATSLTIKFAFLALAAIVLVGGYFVGEIFMPTHGLPGAIKEHAPNTVQGIGGFIGGFILYTLYNTIISDNSASGESDV